MARLEEIRRDNLRLADPRRLSPEEAASLIASGKAIVALNHGIHSNEVAATQTAMETAYRLATGEDEETRAVRDRTVVLMLPSHNPDGTQKVTEWYREQPGHSRGRAGALPFAYQKYTDHDNNRDWYMFTQVESRLTTEHLYDRWRPQIVHDVHQMGIAERAPVRAALRRSLGAQRGPRPHRRRERPRLPRRGAAHHRGPEGRGDPRDLRRVVARARLSPHPRRGAHPDRGRVRAHGHAGRGPVRGARARHRLRPAGAVVELPRPLAGRDLAPARHRGLPGRREPRHRRPRRGPPRALAAHDVRGEPARRRGASSPTRSWSPAEQKDPLAAAALLSVLRTGAVEVHRARSSFEAGGRKYAKGSHVVLMQQPFSGFAKSLLERQRYPDIRPVAGRAAAAAVRRHRAHPAPADGRGRGRGRASDSPPTSSPWSASSVAPGRIEKGRGRFLAFGHRTGDLVALGRLLRDGGPGALGHGGVPGRARASFPAGHAARARSPPAPRWPPLAGRAGPRRPTRCAARRRRSCCARRASASTSRG